MNLDLYLERIVRMVGRGACEMDRMMNRAVDRVMDWRRRDGHYIRARLMKDLKLEYQRLGLSVMPHLKKNNAFGDKKLKDQVTVIDGLNSGIKELDQVESEFIHAEKRLHGLKSEMIRRKALHAKQRAVLADKATNPAMKAKVSAKAESNLAAGGMKKSDPDKTEIRVSSAPPPTPGNDPDGIELDVSDITGVKKK